MPTVQSMLETHPWPGHVDREALAACIEACFACGQTCGVVRRRVPLGGGRRRAAEVHPLNLDCGDICVAAWRVLTRQTEYDASVSKAQLEACREACSTCAEEYERHAEMHEHCRICTEECRRCETACTRVLQAMQ